MKVGPERSMKSNKIHGVSCEIGVNICERNKIGTTDTFEYACNAHFKTSKLSLTEFLREPEEWNFRGFAFEQYKQKS